MSCQYSRRSNQHALRGNDIVDSVVRLCAMNLNLRGIGGDECPICANDALAKEVGDDRVDMVLANPPFGKKSSITVINEKAGKKVQEKLTIEREVFWATTSDKQLNFVQHISAPEVLAQEIVGQLEAALEEFRSVEEVLASSEVAT